MPAKRKKRAAKKPTAKKPRKRAKVGQPTVRGGLARKPGARPGAPKRQPLPHGTRKKVKEDMIALDAMFPNPRERGKLLPPLLETVERLLPLSLSRAALVRKLTGVYGVSRDRVDQAIKAAKDNYQDVLKQSREERISDNIALLRKNAVAAYRSGKYNAVVQSTQLQAKLAGDLLADAVLLPFDVNGDAALQRAEELRAKALEAAKRRNG